MNPHVDGAPSSGGNGGMLLALALTVGGSVLLAGVAWLAVKWNEYRERAVWHRIEREIAAYVDRDLTKWRGVRRRRA